MKHAEPVAVFMVHLMPFLKIGYSSPSNPNDMVFRADYSLLPQDLTSSMSVGQKTRKTSTARPEYGGAWLEMFDAFLQDHLGNSKLKVPILAEHFSISASTLLRTLKRLTGNTPVQYLKAARLEKAHQLLRTGEIDQVGKVASAVGYKGPRSFARIFRERYGKLPSEYLQDRHE